MQRIDNFHTLFSFLAPSFSDNVLFPQRGHEIYKFVQYWVESGSFDKTNHEYIHAILFMFFLSYQFADAKNFTCAEGYRTFFSFNIETVYPGHLIKFPYSYCSTNNVLNVASGLFTHSQTMKFQYFPKFKDLQITISVCLKWRNFSFIKQCGKRRKCCYQHFLLFPHFFQNTSFPKSLKGSQWFTLHLIILSLTL